MRLLAFACVLLLILGSCSRSPQALQVSNPANTADKNEQYRREMDEIRKNITGEIKVRLKRDGKAGVYNWEIDGKDVNEVLKANQVLVKKLGVQ